MSEERVEILKESKEGKLKSLGSFRVDKEKILEVKPSEYGPGFSSVRMKDQTDFTIYSSDAYKINRLDE